MLAREHNTDLLLRGLKPYCKLKAYCSRATRLEAGLQTYCAQAMRPCSSAPLLTSGRVWDGMLVTLREKLRQ